MGLSSAIVVEMSRYDAAFSVSQELDTAPHEIQDVNTGMDLPSNTGCGINTDLTSPHKDMGSRQEWVIMAGDLSTSTPSPAPTIANMTFDKHFLVENLPFFRLWH